MKDFPSPTSFASTLKRGIGMFLYFSGVVQNCSEKIKVLASMLAKISH